MDQTEFRLVHNQKENCHYDHIPLHLKVIRNVFIITFKLKKIYLFKFKKN